MVQTTARITKTGLCSTCNNVSTCFYFSTRGPALFCELFDDHVDYSPPQAARRAPRAAPRVAPRPARRRAAPAAAEAPVPLKGLCVNCEHRSACVYPKPPGGIWHCEEYE
ncbi:MAG: hypothetical protein JSV91_01265 [Phycisphaerales bacterium]|nr:MAG: hypothetical protein JSV91_01265 [Phycisphaerales bacterium]